MYVPAHFQPSDDEVREALRHLGAVDLVTATDDGLLATLMPMLWDEPGSRPGLGPWGALVGHVARNNAQWRTPAIGDAMVIVRGPDAYISPRWYAAKREHGRVVPTWNYVSVQAHGRLVVHDDVEWLETNVRRLTDAHEADAGEPWSVDDAPRSTSTGSSGRSSGSRSSSTASSASGSSARTGPTRTSAGRSRASRPPASGACRRRCGPPPGDPAPSADRRPCRRTCAGREPPTASRSGTRCRGGPGEPVVVLMPGIPFSNTAAEWRIPVLQRAFARLGEQVRFIQYDGRGSGQSQRDVDDLSLDAMLRDLDAVLDAERVGRVVLLGFYHSVMLALAWAARHQARASGLVLFGGSARGWDPMSGPGTQALLTLIDRDWDTFVESAAHAWLGWPDPEPGPPVRRVVPHRDDARDRQGDDARGERDRRPAGASASVRCPVLVLHRTDATVIPLAMSQALAASLPDARLELLPGTTASLFFEDPEGVADRIATFASARRRPHPTRRLTPQPLARAGGPAPRAAPGTLSPREAEVLRAVAKGDSNARDRRVAGDQREHRRAPRLERLPQDRRPRPCRRDRLGPPPRSRMTPRAGPARLTGIRDRDWVDAAMTVEGPDGEDGGMEPTAAANPSSVQPIDHASRSRSRRWASPARSPGAASSRCGPSSSTAVARPAPFAARRSSPSGRMADFIIPMPFGPSTQWTQNVLAAGGASLTWKGRDWQVVDPLVVGLEDASGPLGPMRPSRSGPASRPICAFATPEAREDPSPRPRTA